MPKDYEVGYGKPPIPTRWAKGVSGNPKGREKGHKGLKTDLETTLDAVETLESKMTGKKSKARNQLHAMRRLVERAALGDLKAQALLWPMVMTVLGVEDRHTGPRKMSAQDEAILAAVLGERLADLGGVPLLTDASDAGDAPADHVGNEPEDDASDDTETGDAA